MCRLFKKKDNTEKDKGAYALANKAIGFGNKFGMQDAMQTAFFQGLPKSLETMINKTKTTTGQYMRLDDYKIILHSKKGFVDSLKALGVTIEQVDDILQDTYNKLTEGKQ